MSYNTIKLKKYLDIVNERAAAAAIYPGMLIEITSANAVQAHDSAGQFGQKILALEDELQGNGIDDAYASGDQVQCWHMVPGEEGYAILADGETAVIGSLLESNGDGYLKVADTESAGGVTYPGSVLFVALEALDLSGSSGEESSGALGYNKRLRVMAV